MDEFKGVSEGDLLNVRDRPLVDAYDVHDVGYHILVTRLTEHGLLVVDHGDDNRHADEVLYGDGPDLAVHEQDENGGLGERVAYVEIKTKEDEAWFGRCNERHFKEYVNFANEVDEPVFIWFGLVDSDEDRLLRDGFVRVQSRDQIEGDVIDVTERTVVFDPDDTYDVDGGYEAVDGSDVVGVRPRDDIVGSIPDVHGNRVICLNEDQFRSFPHFLHVIDQ